MSVAVAQSKPCSDDSRSSAGSPSLGFSGGAPTDRGTRSIPASGKTEIDRFHADSASLEQKWFRDANLEALRQLRELGQHPDRYIPERIAFLDAMARAPGVTVSGESYCRIINRSKAMCDRHPGPNPTYFKVRISSGPSKGQEGWGCLGEDIRLNGALAF